VSDVTVRCTEDSELVAAELSLVILCRTWDEVKLVAWANDLLDVLCYYIEQFSFCMVEMVPIVVGSNTY